MRDIGDTKIAELLGVNIHVEKPHESMPAITVGEVGGPGWELVQLLRKLLNETGAFLVNNRYRDLGSFVAEALKEGERVGKANGDEAAVDVIVERVFVASLSTWFYSNNVLVCFSLSGAFQASRTWESLMASVRWQHSLCTINC